MIFSIRHLIVELKRHNNRVLFFERYDYTRLGCLSEEGEKL